MKKTNLLIIAIVIMSMVSSVSATTTERRDYPMCDMNGDGVRNLVDVALFAQVRNIMDLNGDGVSNLIDLSIFQTNRHIRGWCYKTFKPYFEEPEEEPEPAPSTKSSSGTSMSKIKKFLFGDFMAFLRTKFVTHEQLAETHAKILYGEKYSDDIIDCKVSNLMANKLNSSYNYKGWITDPLKTTCTKVIAK